jgi:ferredoxin
VTFSPTGGTRSIVDAIAAGLGEPDPARIDLCRPDVREEFASRGRVRTGNADDARSDVEDTGCVVVGMPVYFGHLPRLLVDTFGKVEGRGRPAVAVVVYGNREFDTALKELVSLLGRAGFRVVGAAAFVAEHTFSSVFPIAVGRPDAEDLSRAAAFGAEVGERLESAPGLTEQDVPGKGNLLMRVLPAPPRPVLDPVKCTKCGICAKYCPMGILDPETFAYRSDEAADRCLGCMRCVKVCRSGSRTVRFPALAVAAMRNTLFREALRVRSEPVTFTKR